MSATEPDLLSTISWGRHEALGLVEDAVRTWLPVVLPTELDQPAVWEQLPSEDAFRSANVPAVAFTSPGLAQVPEHPDGVEGTTNRLSYDAWWLVNVSAWVRGSEGTYSNTTEALGRYLAALRVAVLLGGRDHGNDWLWQDEQYDTPAAAARTLQFGVVQFAIPLYGAVDLTGYPSAGDLPRVTRTYVTVNPNNPEES